MKSRVAKLALWSLAILAALVGVSAAMNHGPDSFYGKIVARLKGLAGPVAAVLAPAHNHEQAVRHAATSFGTP